jgi:hypothetical protein
MRPDGWIRIARADAGGGGGWIVPCSRVLLACMP